MSTMKSKSSTFRFSPRNAINALIFLLAVAALGPFLLTSSFGTPGSSNIDASDSAAPSKSGSTLTPRAGPSLFTAIARRPAGSHTPITEPWWLEAPLNPQRHITIPKALCPERDEICAKSATCLKSKRFLTKCEKKCQKLSPMMKIKLYGSYCGECLRLKKANFDACEVIDKTCKFELLNCMERLMRPGVGALKWFSMWDENNYQPEEYKGWANFGFSANVTRVRRGASLGLQHLLKVGYLFWERTDGHHSPLRLRADFREEWDRAYPEILELYKSKAIFGFCIGDELVWSGATWQEVETAADLIRHDFPGAVIWLNEAVAVVTSGCNHYKTCNVVQQIPPSISWFSVDKYWTSNHPGNKPPGQEVPDSHADRVRNIYTEAVYPKLGPNQSVVLVPGAFGSTHNPKCTIGCYEAFCATDAVDFTLWAISDSRVVGLTPYHWHYCPGCGRSRNEVGVQTMNITRFLWQAIGHRIAEHAGIGNGTYDTSGLEELREAATRMRTSGGLVAGVENVESLLPKVPVVKRVDRAKMHKQSYAQQIIPQHLKTKPNFKKNKASKDSVDTPLVVAVSQEGTVLWQGRDMDEASAAIRIAADQQGAGGNLAKEQVQSIQDVGVEGSNTEDLVLEDDQDPDAEDVDEMVVEDGEAEEGEVEDGEEVSEEISEEEEASKGNSYY